LVGRINQLKSLAEVFRQGKYGFSQFWNWGICLFAKKAAGLKEVIQGDFSKFPEGEKRSFSISMG